MVFSGSELKPAHLRALLCKLRDADLHRRHVALAGSRRVSIEGCLSLDSPVGQALRYLLRWPNGAEEVLEIDAAGGRLTVKVSGRDGQANGEPRSVALTTDERGRATASAWRARIDPENAGLRELDRFLRRIVRAVL
jgi:hypothetical protein